MVCICPARHAELWQGNADTEITVTCKAGNPGLVCIPTLPSACSRRDPPLPRLTLVGGLLPEAPPPVTLPAVPASPVCLHMSPWRTYGGQPFSLMTAVSCTTRSLRET